MLPPFSSYGIIFLNYLQIAFKGEKQMAWQFKKYIKNWEKDFSDFCESTYKNLMSYALKLTVGDRYLAEDIVQETYLLAKINQVYLCNHCNPIRWLYSTAKKLFYQKAKYAKNKNKTEINLTEEIKDEKDFFYNINGEISEITKTGIFLKIFAELSEQDRKLLKDYYIKKIQLKDIADELGENYEKIRKKHFRLSCDIIKKISGEINNSNKQEQEES